MPPKPSVYAVGLQPDNTLSLRHGLYSKRTVDPVAKVLVEALLEDRPDLAKYPETLWALARAEARCLLVDDFLSREGLFDEDGAARPLLKYVAAWERVAAEHRRSLGLDPRGEADLVRSRAEAEHSVIDFDAAREKGRQALKQALGTTPTRAKRTVEGAS